MIHVLGSINIDYSITVDQLPGPGETIPASNLTLTPGGKGANQALAAKRAGTEVKMIGAIGSDTVVVTLPGPTGCAFVFVDKKSENQIVIIAGANAAVTTEHARAMAITTDDILLLQLECPVDTVAAAAANAKQNGAKVVLNLAPYLPLDTEVFKSVDYLILNETEASQLSRHLGLQSDEVEAIAKITGCAVVRTLGANGIEAIDENARRIKLPGVKIDAVDTVGAGDTFAGFLGTMLSTGNSLQNACKVANAAAALACTKPGAQTAIPTMQDVVYLASAHPDTRT